MRETGARLQCDFYAMLKFYIFPESYRPSLTGFKQRSDEIKF